MRNFRLVLLLTVIIFMLVGCSGTLSQPKESISDQQGGIRELNQAEAKKNMDQDKSIILVDVRTPKEYAELHIPGSILIPLDTFNDNAEEKLTDKDATIYVYCRSGNRSGQAVRLLSELGYRNVYNIGGITTWSYDTQRSE